jgi:hypothetical protein
MSGQLQYPFSDIEPDYRHTKLITHAAQQSGGRPHLRTRVRSLVCRYLR